MLKLLRRPFDPVSHAVAGSVALRYATIVALMVGVAVVSGQWSLPLAAVFAAAAVFVAVIGLGLQVIRGLESVRQEARDLWGLAGVIVERRVWPSPGGWGLGADAMAYLLRELPHRRHATVVELGPGTSSVVLGRCLAGTSFFGLEHDADYVASVRKTLDSHELDDYSLIHAPLAPYERGCVKASWYDTAALVKLPDKIDVLIVDGPPNLAGKGNRAAAYWALEDRLDTGSLILVDDAHRGDERRMVEDWMKAAPLDMVLERT
jgi:predicted O-methyltransferase YrrM